jgi:hypothetical protein
VKANPLTFLVNPSLHMLKINILKELCFNANLRAKADILIKRALIVIFPSADVSYSGTTAIASPSNVIPWPENVTTLTNNGPRSYPRVV